MSLEPLYQGLIKDFKRFSQLLLSLPNFFKIFPLLLVLLLLLLLLVLLS